MNGGDDCSAVDRGGRLAVTPVPVGWQRMVEEGGVRYISPSGTSLASLEQTRAYLLADGTCKCGLECPLNMHKVFNFDPAAMVTGSEGSKGDEDMTKLCNHRRKIVAMATLYRSMESHGPLSLPHLGPGPSLSQLPHPTTPGPSSRPQQMLPSKASATLAKGPELYQQCPPDRYGNTWSSPSSPFPRHHNALFGDVFPGRLPATTNGNTQPSFPTELSAVGGPFLPSKALPPDTLSRPYPPGGLLFPPPDEAVSSQEGGPWSSRQVPLGSQTSTTASPAPTTVSSISSPAGSAEPSPQRSRHSSASSEHGLSGHHPAARPPGSDAAAALANALTNQSSNNLPSVPLGVAPEGKGPPSLLLLHPQGPGSFPASSLLSAAAKAQLASRGRPDELAASTLPSRLLLSVVGGRAPRRQRRSPTVLRLLKDSHSAGQAGGAHPEEAQTRHTRPRDQLLAGEAKNGPPSSGAPAQPRSSLLSLLTPPVSSLASAGLPPVPPIPAGDSPGSLPSFQDFNSQLLSLFGQLASASSEQVSGSPPQPKPPASPLGSHSTPGASSASPLTPKAPSAASPVTVSTTAMEGGGLGCPVASGPDPFPFLAQEQVLPFGNPLPPGLLPLGSFPFSLALGPEAPLPPLNLQGDPEGQSLLPLVLPSLDLLQQPSGFLASLLGLPESTCEVEREAAATEPLLEPFTGLHETLQPLLFPALSAPPAVLALNSALLATSLGPSDPGPGPPQTGLASTPVAPTSTSATSTTTEGTPSTSGRLHPLMPQLVNPLLSTTLLGDLSGLNPGSSPSLIGNPLLQAQQPLLPSSLQGPLGLQLFQGQLPLLAASNPLACLLQSLQLSSSFGVPEKSVQPSDAPAPALASGAPAAETEPGHNTALPPSCTDAAPTSALEPPRALEPARQGQQEPPLGQEASSSRSPLKRPRRGTEDLNGDSGSSLPRGPGRGGKSGRRGGGRGRGRRHFNGQLPDLGTGHPSHPAWRCNGEMVASSAESQADPFAVQEIKGPPGRRPARRGRRRKSSGARPSARPEATRIRGPSADPGPSPLVDYTVARRPRPGRPVKNRRRKLPT